MSLTQNHLTKTPHIHPPFPWHRDIHYYLWLFEQLPHDKALNKEIWLAIEQYIYSDCFLFLLNISTFVNRIPHQLLGLNGNMPKSSTMSLSWGKEKASILCSRATTSNSRINWYWNSLLSLDSCYDLFLIHSFKIYSSSLSSWLSWLFIWKKCRCVWSEFTMKILLVFPQSVVVPHEGLELNTDNERLRTQFCSPFH